MLMADMDLRQVPLAVCWDVVVPGRFLVATYDDVNAAELFGPMAGDQLAAQVVTVRAGVAVRVRLMISTAWSPVPIVNTGANGPTAVAWAARLL